jgi:hypothetical protein
VTGDDVKLSSSVTVRRYRELEQAGDRKALADFVRERFQERYFRPVERSDSRHGFLLMAVACLVIETLESSYQGLGDTREKSKKMFREFLKRDTPLKVFGRDGDWFYEDIRCGILHQAEVRAGWRIRRDGPLLDTTARAINASLFFAEVLHAVEVYAQNLEQNDECWASFRRKMQTVCKNCSNAHHGADKAPE